jgi:hypothetical protein
MINFRSGRVRAATVTLAVTFLGIGLSASSCGDDPPTAQQSGQADTEQAFQQQSSAVPYPKDQLRDSLERRNLKAKLLRDNVPTRLGYVYLVSLGKCMGFYAIRGKVSSTQSQMTTSTLVERHGDTGGGNITYEAPGDDGSYGANEPGIFFFTTEGVMVETSLDYQVADAPLPFDCPKLNAPRTQQGADPTQ